MDSTNIRKNRHPWGVSIREVARKMGRSKGAIHKFKEKARETDFVTACKQSPGQGRKKHSASVMVWGMFDGRFGRGGLSLVPRVTSHTPGLL